MVKTTGLVLSGGGARGIAHIGVFRALDELGIQVNTISGVSAGAIFGAFYAAGISNPEMMKIATEANLFDLMDFRIGKPGLFKSEAIRKTLERNLPISKQEDLPIPLIIAATDFIHAKTDYFTQGELVKNLVASSAIPVIFQPEIIENKVYVDGGLLNNLPVEPLIGKVDVLIGIHVNPINKSIKDLTLRNMVERSFHMAISNSIREKSVLVDVFIEPEALKHFHVFDMEHASEIAAIGYHATMERKVELTNLYA